MTKLTRRQFLKLTGAAAPTSDHAYLAVARGPDRAAITRMAIAALGGIERFVPPEYAAMTDPTVVATLVALCLGAGARRVRVMGTPFGGTQESAYAVSGIGRVFTLGLFVFVLLLSGCGGRASSLADIFPDADVFLGWTPTCDVEVFDRENIFDLVDGQAEAFFAYGFEQVAVRRYENAEGATLDIEVWQLATPADAYGLFTASIAGEPAEIGNDSDADPGRRLAFWQDRYTVQVRARQQLDDADLWGFAEVVSTALPSGGEQPALVGRLPPEGLVERSTIFFHEEISIQDQLWLGGENLLGLGPETDGVLARYEVGSATVQLLLVEYPEAEAATAGLAALEGGGVSGLVTAAARSNLLGAVFGEMDGAAARELLAGALDNG